jgi:hypothetical protein
MRLAEAFRNHVKNWDSLFYNVDYPSKSRWVKQKRVASRIVLAAQGLIPGMLGVVWVRAAIGAPDASFGAALDVTLTTAFVSIFTVLPPHLISICIRDRRMYDGTVERQDRIQQQVRSLLAQANEATHRTPS